MEVNEKWPDAARVETADLERWHPGKNVVCLKKQKDIVHITY